MKNLVVFIVFTLLTQGCSYYDIVKKNKAEYLEAPEEKISKVVFESGEFIQFNKDGGNYCKLNNCIAGMTWGQGFTIIPINEISKIQSNWGDLSPDKDLFADTAQICSVSLNDGKSFLFRQRYGGGRYYSDNKEIIAGIDTSSKYYHIGIDNISYLDVYKFNYTKSIIADIGLAGLGAATVYIIFKFIFLNMHFFSGPAFEL
jgi:hypothetical protein